MQQRPFPPAAHARLGTVWQCREFRCLPSPTAARLGRSLTPSPAALMTPQPRGPSCGLLGLAPASVPSGAQPPQIVPRGLCGLVAPAQVQRSLAFVSRTWLAQVFKGCDRGRGPLPTVGWTQHLAGPQSPHHVVTACADPAASSPCNTCLLP